MRQVLSAELWLTDCLWLTGKGDDNQCCPHLLALAKTSPVVLGTKGSFSSSGESFCGAVPLVPAKLAMVFNKPFCGFRLGVDPMVQFLNQQCYCAARLIRSTSLPRTRPGEAAKLLLAPVWELKWAKPRESAGKAI